MMSNEFFFAEFLRNLCQCEAHSQWILLVNEAFIGFSFDPVLFE